MFSCVYCKSLILIGHPHTVKLAQTAAHQNPEFNKTDLSKKEPEDYVTDFGNFY